MSEEQKALEKMNSWFNLKANDGLYNEYVLVEKGLTRLERMEITDIIEIKKTHLLLEEIKIIKCKMNDIMFKLFHLKYNDIMEADLEYARVIDYIHGIVTKYEE